jgi:hypothetical protein
MIPVTDILPDVPSRLPTCKMPSSDEISDEGFGYFRGTWFIGRVSVEEARSIVSVEAELIQLLDRVASSANQFELLASAIERQDVDQLPDGLHSRALENGLRRFVTGGEDHHPLDGLEIGVAGLVYALSALRCLTAASCRSHVTSRSWSDCPVVFFAARAWRIEVLAGLIAAEGCGLRQDRGMLTVYGPSIQDTHRLAQRILVERAGFRKTRDRRVASRSLPVVDHAQLNLLSDWS